MDQRYLLTVSTLLLLAAPACGKDDSDDGTTSGGTSSGSTSGTSEGSSSGGVTSEGTSSSGGTSEGTSEGTSSTSADSSSSGEPPVVCGDGMLGGDEQCDDGNLDPGDFCDAACAIESRTFSFTGAEESFVMPAWATALQIEAWGAQGGGSACCDPPDDDDGGLGGHAVGTVEVAAGTDVHVFVGGAGTAGEGPGGWNGGGAAGEYGGSGGGAYAAGAGGGSSYIGVLQDAATTSGERMGDGEVIVTPIVQ